MFRGGKSQLLSLKQTDVFLPPVSKCIVRPSMKCSPLKGGCLTDSEQNVSCTVLLLHYPSWTTSMTHKHSNIFHIFFSLQMVKPAPLLYGTTWYSPCCDTHQWQRQSTEEHCLKTMNYLRDAACTITSNLPMCINILHQVQWTSSCGEMHCAGTECIS